MLSLKSGFEIAQIRDKKDKIIHSIYVKDYDEDSTEQINKDIEKLIDKSFYKNVSPSQIILLKRALRTDNESILKMNQNLLDLYQKGKILLDDQKNKIIVVDKDEHNSYFHQISSDYRKLSANLLYPKNILLEQLFVMQLMF